MKTFIFSKLVDDISVGHLYEHIFCDALTLGLRENGFFSYVDYSLDAKTYHDGVVVIEIDIYNAQAVEFIETYKQPSLDINADLINGGLLQIMAELESDIIRLDIDAVQTKLGAYSKNPWQDIKVTPPSDWVASEPSIEYGDTEGSAFGVIEQRISINSAALTQELHPLYLIISKALRSNLIEEVTAGIFCFTYENDFIMTDEILTDVNLYRVDKRQVLQITSEPELASRLIEDMLNQGFVERLGESLRNAEPDSAEYPVSDEIEAKLGVVVSDDVWKQTATYENIRKLMNALNITFTFRS